MLKGRCPLLHRCRFSTKQTLNSQECFCAGGAALLIHLLSDWIRVAPAGRRHQLEDKDLGPFTRLQALGRVGDAKLPSWPRGPAMDRQTPNESWWDWGGFGLQVDPEPQSFSSGLTPSLATTASSSLRSHSFTPDLILSLFFWQYQIPFLTLSLFPEVSLGRISGPTVATPLLFTKTLCINIHKRAN